MLMRRGYNVLVCLVVAAVLAGSIPVSAARALRTLIDSVADGAATDNDLDSSTHVPLAETLDISDAPRTAAKTPDFSVMEDALNEHPYVALRWEKDSRTGRNLKQTDSYDYGNIAGDAANGQQGNGNSTTSANTPASTGNKGRRHRVYCQPQFVSAVQQGQVFQLVQNVSQGLDNTTDGVLWAQGSAMAEAVAGTLDGQQAVALAYATALCEQGETASAFSDAFVVTVFCEEATGCQVLAMAHSTASAQCSAVGGEVFSEATASSSAYAALLGHCKLMPGLDTKLRDVQIPSSMNLNITRRAMRRMLPRGALNKCRKVCNP